MKTMIMMCLVSIVEINGDDPIQLGAITLVKVTKMQLFVLREKHGCPMHGYGMGG